MTEKKYMTVVFEYEEGSELPDEIMSAFDSIGNKYRDAQITTISWVDEISRIEQIEKTISSQKRNRDYFELGCLCIENGSLPKVDASVPDPLAIQNYENNCKCSRNYK